MRPVIGITGSARANGTAEAVECSLDTIEAITFNNGLAVVIPFSTKMDEIESLADKIDGLLLSGGNDIDPYYYGEQPLYELGKVHPLRDELEIRLTRAMLKMNKPVLGICRGCQVLNVATNGTMYQDIHSQVRNSIQHSQKAPRYHKSHSVEVAADTLLYQILGTPQTVRVNSYHHQANRTVGPDFRVSAVAPDGIVEAIESVKYRFAVGVQWHPENMFRTDALSNLLFKSFINACNN